MEQDRGSILRSDPYCQCSVLLQSCFLHIDSMKEMMFNERDTGSVDTNSLMKAIENLQKISSTVFNNINSSESPSDGASDAESDDGDNDGSSDYGDSDGGSYDESDDGDSYDESDDGDSDDESDGGDGDGDGDDVMDEIIFIIDKPTCAIYDIYNTTQF